ncbi:efflux RND transporter permease subunit [Sphaerochaeta sp.]|uniref:efflux RND transporter permease subunit n=1 Tax=Sphaerochaeta sp. TaxID=1972642 RepID=UPI003D132261
MKFDLLRLIGKHSKLTLAIIMVITAFFLYHAAFLHLNADYNSLMTELQGQTTYVVESGVQAQTKTSSVPSSDQIPETGKLETGSLGNHLVASTEPTAPPASDEPSYTTTYLVMIESPALYTAEHLSLIEATIQALEHTEYLSKSYSVLDFVTLEKRGTRLATMPFSSHQENQNSWTDEEAQLLKSRIASDPLVRNYLVSEDLQGFLFSFESTALTEAQEQELADMLGTLTEAGMKISINGGAVITNRLMHYLGRDLSILLSLCFVAILLVYYLSFKAKRSVLLPFSMSVIGIIWTFGTMRLLGYSLTIVNIVTPCMVLNLGSSYAIHVIGEYYTDYSKGMNSIESTKKILRTIFFACVTTVIGFMSLLFSKTQALREFGVAVGFGVTYCAVLASTYLPAQLSLVVPPKKEQIRTYRKGYLARAVLLFDRTVAKKWPLFVLLWVLVIAGYALTRDHIPVNTNYMSYLPKRDPFGKSSQHFAQQMGGDIPYVLTIEAPEGEEKFFLKSENLGSVYSFEQALSTQSEDIRQILSFASYVSFANSVYSDEEGIPTSDGLLNLLSRMVLLMSRQGQEELSSILNVEGTKLTIYLQHFDAEEQALWTLGSAERIEETILANLHLLPNGSKLTISGEPHKTLNFSADLLHDQRMSTYASYLLVFLVVLFAFKSLSLALYALIPILTGVMANYIFMYFFQIPFDMITVSFAAVAVGTGIDDAIHFLIRYKNKLGKDDRSTEALLSETIRETGRPIILTTLSIIAGMMMFLFASYTPVRYFGSLMSMALLNCMLSTLLIMPSVIRLEAFLKRRFPRKI